MLQITSQSTASEIAAQMSILMRGTVCGSKKSLITLSQLTSSGAREHASSKADDLLSVALLQPPLYLSNLVSVVLIIYPFDYDMTLVDKDRHSCLYSIIQPLCNDFFLICLNKFGMIQEYNLYDNLYCVEQDEQPW